MPTFAELRPKLAFGGVVLLLAGGVLWWYTDGFGLATPEPMTQAMRVQHPGTSTSQEKPKKTSPTPAAVPPANMPPLATTPTTALALQHFSTKQAQLEEARINVAIAEQDAKFQELQSKIKELREGKPSAPVSMQASLPVLPLLPEPMPTGQLPVPSEFDLSSLPASQNRKQTGLVSIQGIDGVLVAVFASANGKRTVRVGDLILGSRVRHITLDSVTLQSGKTLTLED